jgi:hypothetical protein
VTGQVLRLENRTRTAAEFMDFPPRKKRRAIIQHSMIISAAALTLIGFRLADDEITGKAEVSDAFGSTLFFLAAGYYISWLPRIWKKSNRTAFEPLVMPVFIAMIVAYLYFSVRNRCCRS